MPEILAELAMRVYESVIDPFNKKFKKLFTTEAQSTQRKILIC